jgi:biotin synthase-related radical SAM superfamily protein
LIEAMNESIFKKLKREARERKLERKVKVFRK